MGLISMGKYTYERVVFSLAFVLIAGSAKALHFPESCRTPGGIVTGIYDLDSEKALMVGQHTLPDIIWSCTEGHVHQGVMKTSDCIAAYIEMGGFDHNSLYAQADCMKGTVTVNGLLTVFPISPACANGGGQAIKAFELLCPNSDLKLRLSN